MGEPTRLYKYRSLATEEHVKRARRMLTANCVWFASPASFNDPFDCKFRLRFDAPLGAKKDAYFEYLRWVHQYSKKKANREVSSMFRGRASRDVQAWEEGRYEHIAKTVQRMGVFSLTEAPDDVLMWSHYADCHRGICLDFRLTRQEHIDFFAEAFEVKYQAAFPRINFYTRREGEKLKGLLLTKSNRWQYERERRMIDLEGWGERPIPAGVLNGVILGARISQANRAEVLGWLRACPTSMSVYEAQLLESTYGLRIVRYRDDSRTS